MRRAMTRARWTRSSRVTQPAAAALQNGARSGLCSSTSTCGTWPSRRLGMQDTCSRIFHWTPYAPLASYMALVSAHTLTHLPSVTQIRAKLLCRDGSLARPQDVSCPVLKRVIAELSKVCFAGDGKQFRSLTHLSPVFFICLSWHSLP